MLEEVESSLARMGDTGVRNGFEAIAATVDHFCAESHAQGLIDRTVDAREVFADFLAER